MNERKEEVIDATLRLAGKIKISQLGIFCHFPTKGAILFSRELHTKNEPLRAFFTSLITSHHKHFSELIQTEIAASQYKKTQNNTDSAYVIFALIQGLAMRWSLNNHNFNLPKKSAFA